jgi:hypothetical protein
MIVIIISAVTSGLSQTAKHEAIEWSDIWIYNANSDSLPRVLLVGDSIVRGYYPLVEKQLHGFANCARYTTSKFLGHPDYFTELDLILQRFTFDILYLNNGLHGWDYSEQDYHKALNYIITTLRFKYPAAQLIWCHSTPVRNRNDLTTFRDRNERVIRRNKIANEIMRAHNIPIIDLYDVMKDHPEYYVKDGAHYNDIGKQVQADKAVGIIKRYLN